jgi:superfamily II RNA helicase
MKLDPFQEQAIEYINKGFSVLVSAPTGSGKTVIAEHVINDSLAKGVKAVYTAPIKALSNQKFRDFQGIYGDKIGIMTGDVSINPHAPVLIMTTEIFRNKVLSEKPELEGYSWVIFDEIHYLDDYERGTVWEESLIFLPDHMKLLGLSATVPNIEQFAEWISSIHSKHMKVVVEKTRPVPLSFLFQHNNRIVDNFRKIRPEVRKSYYHRGRGRRVMTDENSRPNKLSPLITELDENNRLPCIYFAFSRKRCEILADEISCFDFLDDAEKDEVVSLFDQLCERFSLTGEKSAENLRPLARRGIAYHHAGMLPTLKEVVERLFTSRLIRMIFTTETFALGINMPARTVVFDELRKYYGSSFATLKTRDFYQMAGRAGRRGIDTAGFVYSRVNTRYTNPGELKRMIYGEPENVSSRFNASYATILNLYSRFGENLYDIYPRSFHWFQVEKNRRAKALQQMRNKVALLASLGYIDERGLTAKGVFAGKLYGYELSLTELYDKGHLDGLSSLELGVLITALVFEPRKTAEPPKLTRTAKYLREITDRTVFEIHRHEKKCGLWDNSKEYAYNLSAAVEGWMRNEPFEKILEATDADEGEIIRYFRMSLQIFREILDTNAPDPLKLKIREAITLINRDVVDAEKQLRE